MATLTTIADVDAELAATAECFVSRSVTDAKRRHAALTRKLDFAATGEDGSGRKFSFNLDVLSAQLAKLESLITSLETSTMSESDRLASPRMSAASFSTFNRYAESS